MNSAKCSKCGFVGWLDAEYCKKCGALMAESADPTYQAPQPYNSYVSPYQYPVDVKKGLAIWSLVIGCLGFFTFGLFGVGAVIGIIMAIVATRRADRMPSEYGGKPLATAGLVTNILALVMVVPIGIIAAIAIPNLLAARRAANEGVAIRSIRTISSAEATYQSLHGTFADMDQLGSSQLINAELAKGQRSGYKYKIELIDNGREMPPGFEAVITPIEYPWSGRRSFYLDQTGVIRGGDLNGRNATKDHPPLDIEMPSYSSYPPSSTNYRVETP